MDKETIVTALRCDLRRTDCNECSYYICDNLQFYCDHLRLDCDAADLIEAQAAEIERLMAERSAAVADINQDCAHCNYAVENGACRLLPEGDQFSPDYTEGFDRDGNCEHWQWRGPQGAREGV